MNKEKLITYALCIICCLAIWAAIITVLVALRRNFNAIAGIIMILAWIWACRLIKKKVHSHYHKDPDTKEAAKLGMSVEHFRKCKAADKKVMAIYKQFGTDSATANKEIDKILATLPSMEEWRRYEDYKMQENVGNMQSMTESLFNGTFDKGYKI